ncbi:MAG: class B sortase [Lachnospiraceae bacterium]
MAKRKKKKTFKDYLLTVILLVAIVVFAYSAYQLYSTFSEYKAGEEEYAAIEEEVITQKEETQSELVQIQQNETLQPPIEVDFAALKAVNEDVVGWIYIEAIGVSYPIVQGTDNEYYLHRTYERTYNFAGSIFVDAEASPDFSDLNTIVYGHNMKNGSMFASLLKIVSERAYDTNHYFWILTPQGNYCYEMFSAYTTAPTSDTYTVFSGPSQEYNDYLTKMLGQSEIDMELKSVGPEDKIVTLSTCTNRDDNRFVVQGKRIQ